MENHKPDTTGKFIEDIIAAEEKEALARFRACDFLSHIEKRLQSLPAESFRSRLRRMIWRPAWVVILGVALLGGMALRLVIHRSPRPNFSATIEQALHRMPGFQAIEGSVPLPSEMRASATSSWEKRIADALSRPSAEAAKSQIRSPESRAGQIRRGRPLSLEEIYKILFMEKSVERVLSLIS